MDSFASIFEKINLPMDEWLFDINAFEQKEVIDKSKGKIICKINEKNSNSVFLAHIFDINIKKSTKFEESNLPHILHIISNLNHISILNFKGFSPVSFKNKPNPVIVTENASNGNLFNILDKVRKSSNYSSWTNTKKLINIYGIASGMKYLHSQDVIHRQLQPSSVFLDDFLFPKLSNFEASKKMTEPSDSTEFEIFVEPSYVAPEIWQRKGYSKSSDVYAFSMIFYEIITNKKPQQMSKLRTKIMNDVVNKGYRPDIDYSIPKFFQRLIKSCWLSDPNKRPTFSDIVSELKNIKNFDEFEINKDEYLQYIKTIDQQEKELDSSESNEYSSENETTVEIVEKEKNQIKLSESVTFVDIDNFIETCKRIGEGTFAKITIVEDIITGQTYAGKELKVETDIYSMNDDENIKNIFNELNIMSKMNFPSIIKFYGFSPVNFVNKKKPIIIMEYAPNGTLQDIFELEERCLPPSEWNDTKKMINIFGIASAMKYLHSLNIIHRDLKPENILEDDFLFPKITDFGLSKIVTKSDESMTKLIGTPIYMAPELIKEGKYSFQSDVFSFALVLYQFFSIQKPFKDARNAFDLHMKKMKGERPEMDFEIPDFYRDLIKKCWDDDPAKRPTFSEIVDMLKTDEALLEFAELDEFLDYVDYIEGISSGPSETLNENQNQQRQQDQQQQQNQQQQKPLAPTKTFQKIHVDFTRLMHSKEIVVSSTTPKLDLNEFMIKEKLGFGGFAEVFRIERKDSEENYAAKILNKEIDSLKENERFCVLREIAILPKVKYEPIVKFIGYSLVDFDQEPRPVFVTEIAPYGSLNDILELERKGCSVDDWDDTKRLINIYGIACGMKYLHSHSILHRDLKPPNILLDEYLYPKITDFGLSRPYNQLNKISEHNTGIEGTIQYISPEIFRSCDYSCASDVYAFAFIVYEIITREKPLKSFTYPYTIMTKVADENYRPPFEFPIPKCYKNLIERCWNANKKIRPSFDEIVQQLKTNPEFINENVDFDEFYEYTELINEVYPTTYDYKPKNEPVKKTKKKTFSIPNTAQKITEITISSFQRIIETEKEDPTFNDCFIDLNQFEQLKIIKKEEFSTIFKVINKTTNKKYAARISKIDMNQFTEKEMKNISHEMNLISLINHPCILKFVGFSPKSFNNEAKPVIINELLKTKTLKEILKKERDSGLVAGWNSTRKLIAIYGIASAMKSLHSYDIIHRNLNPASILVDSSFLPKLSDFGLCTHLLIVSSMTFQSTNKIAYSPTYSAPELLNSEEASKSSDVYSFGMVVYEIISREKPFSNLNNFSQIYQEVVINQKHPVLSFEIPESYRKLIEICLSPNKEERPRFDQIIEILKNEPGFITEDVDHNSYLKYMKKIDKNSIKKHHHHHRHKHSQNRI